MTIHSMAEDVDAVGAEDALGLLDDEAAGRSLSLLGMDVQGSPL